jgi:Fic family protein
MCYDDTIAYYIYIVNMSLYCIVNDNILTSLRAVLLDRTSIRSLPESVWTRVATLNTWGTNAIEGNSLTLEEVTTVLEGGQSVCARPIHDVMETVQHEAAFRSLTKRLDAPVSLVTILEMHEEVFRLIMPDAGQWRRVNVRIEGSKYTPPRLEKVIPLMDSWVKDYDQKDREGEDVFELAARTHHAFEQIHPFSNGNGRVGRLLLNRHFLKHNWPPVSITMAERRAYLKSLEKANSGDLTDLVRLLKVLMASSLVGILDEVGTEQDRLQPFKEMEKEAGKSAKYLTLRAGQGYLPAIKVKGDWHTSKRALALYSEVHGRR